MKTNAFPVHYAAAQEKGNPLGVCKMFFYSVYMIIRMMMMMHKKMRVLCTLGGIFLIRAF